MNVLHQKLINISEKIGNDLLDSCIESNYGIFWKTLGRSNEGLSKIESLDIYSGSSGIILYLIELYKTTGDLRYYEAVINASNHVLEKFQMNEISNMGFYTGGSGIVFVLLKVYKLTSEEKFLNGALTILHKAKISYGMYDFDLLSGKAGLIIIYLHLHQETKESWIINSLREAIEHLLSIAKISTKGVYWQDKYLNIAPLNGLSHGSTGVAHAFFEAGHYLGDDSLIRLGYEIIGYENCFFDRVKGTWPDFRTGILSELDVITRKEELKNGITTYLYPNDTVAWCNGPIGIGLARIHLFNLTRNELFKNDLKYTLIPSIKWCSSKNLEKFSFSLCHGAGGMGMLFIKAFKLTNDLSYLKHARKVVRGAVNQFIDINYFKNGYSKYSDVVDFSLLNGSPGVGYFFLKFINQDDESILLPTIQKSESPKEFVGTCNIDLRLTLKSSFKRTLLLLKPYSYRINIDMEQNVIEEIMSIVHNIPDQRLKTTFFLEYEIIKLNESIENKALEHLKEMISIEKNEEFLTSIKYDQRKLLDNIYFISPKIKLIELDFYCEYNPLLESFHSYTNKQFILLKQFKDSVQELKINKFVYIILSEIAKGNTGNQIKEFISNSIQYHEILDIELKITSQIIEGLKKGIITKEKHELTEI